MNVLLLPWGSDGDVNPHIGLGVALRARGHRVVVVANERFSSCVCRTGLDFVPLGTTEDYRAAIQDPEQAKAGLLGSFRAWRVLKRTFMKEMRPQYQIIADRYIAGRTVLCASPLAIGARIAHIKLHIPMATLYSTPAVYRSAYKPPAGASGLVLPEWSPRLLNRAFFLLGDTVGGRLPTGPIKDFCADLGIAPTRRLTRVLWHAPQRDIALFPEWFCPRQADWPTQTRLTEFPLYDRADTEKFPVEAREFVGTGDAPLVFTTCMGAGQGARFFDVAAEACLRLERRGLLVSPASIESARSVSDRIRFFTYLPYGTLLPRGAVLVHSGGIGTSAQAMAAGIPQLVVPVVYDQTNNAVLLKRLGVGEWIRPSAFRTEIVVAKLRYLLESSAVAEQCRRIAGMFKGVDPFRRTCELLEELEGTDTTSAPTVSTLTE